MAGILLYHALLNASAGVMNLDELHFKVGCVVLRSPVAWPGFILRQRARAFTTTVKRLTPDVKYCSCQNSDTKCQILQLSKY